MLDLLISLGVSKQYVGDVWVAILFVGTSLLLIALVKRQNLGALIAAIYGAYAIETKIFFDFLSDPTLRFITLLVMSVMLLLVFKKFFGEVAIGRNLLSEWIKAGLVSATIVGFAASIVMDWYSKAVLSGFFSTFSMSIFRSDEAQLVWMVAPILVIYLLNLRR
ncbi:hypothetical protein HN784_01150 [bacterium]|jgi:hypothetical protein|nr:hypothetical protein [bacterium]MBT4251684.1 hypothetical protein [bacterium]MBT4597734.1 hypothetical protein [bacterium]MBT6753746.1 hypothetical protein [bacterium]MBT7037883.1 hypothetical protein [bacterium]